MCQNWVHYGVCQSYTTGFITPGTAAAESDSDGQAEP